jgi:SPOR domain
MQDLIDDPYDDSAPRSAGLMTGVMRWTGALMSLAILAGVAFWTYRLGQRDAGAVPVILAMEGPAREAPEDPGGYRPANQGLTVNAIVAGTLSPPRKADRTKLAPPPEEPAAEDKPAGELVPEVTESLAAPAEAPAGESPVGELAVPAGPAGLDAPATEAPQSPAVLRTATRSEAAPVAAAPMTEREPAVPAAAGPVAVTIAVPEPVPAPSADQAAARPEVARVAELTRSLSLAAPAAEASRPTLPLHAPTAEPPPTAPAARPETASATAPLAVMATATKAPAAETPAAATPVETTAATTTATTTATTATAATPVPAEKPAKAAAPGGVATATAPEAAAPEPATILAPKRSDLPPKRPSIIVAAATPATSPANATAPAAPDPTAPTDSALFPPKGTVLVQLGAFESPEVARAQWDAILKDNADLLGRKGPLVQRTVSAGRVFFRLRAEGFGDLAEARATCAALIARGGICITARQE